jgi:glycosyltransferase involved in cell wall biosynthesis
MRLAVNGRFLTARVTGVQRFAREIVRRLADHTDVVLLLPRRARVPDDWPAGMAVAVGRLCGHAWEQLELPAMAARTRCDVVLNAGGTTPGYGGPHVAVVHDILPLTNPEWFDAPFALWYRYAVRRNAARAARIITVSAASSQAIVEVLGVPAERVDVVVQGLAPFDRPAGPAAVERVRRRHGIAGPYLLATGRGDPRKNLGFLAGVLRTLRARGRPAPALVVTGRPTRRVHGRHDDAPAGAILTGYVADDELHALYTGALAFVFPSRAEGFGRPPLEAMACGTPALVAPYDGARELVGAARVLPLAPAAWADAIEELDRATHPRGSPLIDLARFSWDAAARAVAEACRRAARVARPAA